MSCMTHQIIGFVNNKIIDNYRCIDIEIVMDVDVGTTSERNQRIDHERPEKYGHREISNMFNSMLQLKKLCNAQHEIYVDFTFNRRRRGGINKWPFIEQKIVDFK